MSHSKAKKQRQKKVREGKRNPELSRSPFAFTDMQTRMTKTKKDKLYHCKHKNSLTDDRTEGSFYLPNLLMIRNNPRELKTLTFREGIIILLTC
ncbi:hypothetical protein JOD43_004318 [Pullulanibacillus pueri]|uniref:hypothetical protein n=1 Tax=Pullulanibacillus pueri TaxID=1437324 RepID=UPI001E2B2160|nr:hypothetical protein [Pullulanibacillus pueri]MBM7684105.1 hypothetical protein [Pullulanibacillus pueri]